MKFAVISTSQVPSTTANSIQVMKVCQAYVQLGHQVKLFVPGSRSFEWQSIAGHYGLRHEFDIRWIPTRKKYRRYDFAFNSLKFARIWNAKMIHTWTPQVALLAGVRIMPFLLELHELPSGIFGPLIYQLLLQIDSKKRFLPITYALKNRYSNYYKKKFDDNEWIIAPDGVDLERYEDLPSPSLSRKQLGIVDKFSAVYTGHLYAGRGMQILEQLAVSFPDIQFLWVGGRPEDVQIWRERINEKAISNIILTGFVPNKDIPLYQASGEILLMPYQKEISGSSGGNTVDICSPMKMFEYMAAGRAIMTSNLPVLHEVLTKNNAVFCTPDDPQDWIQKMLFLLKDENFRLQISEQARIDVEGYSWMERAKKSLDGFVYE